MPSSLPNPPNPSNPYEKIRPNSNGRIAKMQYPSDMGRYYIAFEFAQYSSQYNSGASDLANLSGIRDAINLGVGAINYLANSNIVPSIKPKAATAVYGVGPVNAAIALPVPNNLVDDQQLDYNAQNLLNVAAQAMPPSLPIQTGNLDAINKFQSVYTGQTVNPFLAMMFNGPRFKTHQFAWRFSPKTQQESETLVRIINTFKSKALPVQWFGGTLFAYPEVCMISLYPDKARNNMYRFKPAVITQTSVHYAPSGTPSFFANSQAPAEIEFKIQLSEISIWTHNDIPDYEATPGLL